MSADAFVTFMYGVGLGAFIANSLGWWRARQPTQEHVIGAKIIEAGKDVLFTRKVSGDDVAIRNTHILRIGQEQVVVAVTDGAKAEMRA